MAWEKLVDVIVSTLHKWPVWVTLLIVFVISWFGAPLGFMLYTSKVILPEFKQALEEQTKRFLEERAALREANLREIQLITSSFEQALHKQEIRSDKTIELLERLTTGVKQWQKEINQ